MFLQDPSLSTLSVQRLALILNTVLLIAILLALEIVYADRPKEAKRQLRLFLPLIALFAGLLIFAAYKQQRGW